jgi:hypothetical protein
LLRASMLFFVLSIVLRMEALTSSRR